MCLENLLQKLSAQKVARKIFQLYWKIRSCDNQALPGPSTSRSTTEALGTRLSQIVPPSLSKACSKLAPTTWNKQREHNLSTACELICYNLFAGLSQLVRSKIAHEIQRERVETSEKITNLELVKFDDVT